MRDSNVHHLPLGGRLAQREEKSFRSEPEQLELFDHAYTSIPTISYLDIAVLDQDRFIRSVIMNAVTTIIDLRGVPVFPKPRFDHRFLMSYFYERSVNYIECAMIRKLPAERICAGESLNQWFSATLTSGMTACIIDDDAVREGAVASFRKSVAKSATGYVEIHPRALI